MNQRDQELQLEQLLRDLALGHGALVLVEEPAGIGKTEVLRLAHSMAPSHEGEGRVLPPHSGMRALPPSGPRSRVGRRAGAQVESAAPRRSQHCDHGQGGGRRWGRSTYPARSISILCRDAEVPRCWSRGIAC
jgi:hypothetical protein